MNEELPIPYFVDIIDLHSLSHDDLRGHINRVGVEIYRREEMKKNDRRDASPVEFG